MGDYTLYIALTYSVSGFSLALLGVFTYRAMKKAETEAAHLRRMRKKAD